MDRDVQRSRRASGLQRVGAALLLGGGFLSLLLLGLAWRGMAAVVRPQSEGASVCFYTDPWDSRVRCVSRAFPQAAASITDRLSLRLQALIAGPTPEERAAGLWSPLPAGARLASFQWSGTILTLYLELPAAYLERTAPQDPVLSPWTVDQALYLFLRHLEPFGVQNVQVMARNPADGRFYALSGFLREPPPLNKPTELAKASGETLQPLSVSGPPAYSRPQASGFLSGKAIYLSAGHGWYWYAPGGRWLTQRGNTNGLVEDLNNAEVVNQFLIQYLYNAGADVWPVRERDMNTWEGIADNDNPATYQEQGPWSPGTLPGYNGGTYRTALTALGTATAMAVWTLVPPRDGLYAVYAWYASGSNRSTDAQFLIEHAGGRSEVRINQQGHGYTWRYLGTFPFRGGQPARVILTNRTDRPENLNRVVIADAVRIGGGMGTVLGDGPPPSPGPSGRPRWEEAARYWAKYQGAPPSVYDPFQCSTFSACGDAIDDVTARPRYAEWEREPFDDPVYFSFHTNAYNGTLRGTESYVYDNSDPNYQRTPGSLELQNAVHTQVIQDLRAAWDPNWIDRGKKQANLGELRLLSTMPGVLMEVAFHDNPQDAAALKDPRFAQIVARAIYKGIVRYYAQRDGRAPVFLPKPPQAPVARQTGPGQVTLSWQPSPSDGGVLLGHPATAYKVYTSTDGFAWSDGVLVNGTTWTLSGLPEGRTVFFRVTGVNAGGESFPTPAVGVRVGPWGAPRLLIVDGFDRLDAAMRPVEDLGGSLGLVTRMPLARMNGFDALAGIGRALSLPFDGATDEAVASGALPLEGYAAVIWALGEEGFSEPTLDDAARARLRTYLSNGGRLILSGSNVGQDLSQRDPGFLRDVLRAGFSADDAGTPNRAPGLGRAAGRHRRSHAGRRDDGQPPGDHAGRADAGSRSPDPDAVSGRTGGGHLFRRALPPGGRLRVPAGERLAHKRPSRAAGPPPERDAGLRGPAGDDHHRADPQRAAEPDPHHRRDGLAVGCHGGSGRAPADERPAVVERFGLGGRAGLADRHRPPHLVLVPAFGSGGWNVWGAGPGGPGHHRGSHPRCGDLHPGPHAAGDTGPDHPHGDDDLHPAGPDGVDAYGRRDAGRIRGADQHRPLHGNCAALPGQPGSWGISVDGRRLRRGR
jgi:hypothetical protein